LMRTSMSQELNQAAQAQNQYSFLVQYCYRLIRNISLSIND